MQNAANNDSKKKRREAPTDRRQTVAAVPRCARWSYRSLKIITSVTRSIDQKSSNYGGNDRGPLSSL